MRIHKHWILARLPGPTGLAKYLAPPAGQGGLPVTCFEMTDGMFFLSKEEAGRYIERFLARPDPGLYWLMTFHPRAVIMIEEEIIS